jgi:hypothetical protein
LGKIQQNPLDSERGQGMALSEEYESLVYIDLSTSCLNNFKTSGRIITILSRVESPNCPLSKSLPFISVALN